MSTSPLGSQVFWTGELSSLRPAPVTPNLPYCQTISPEGSTRTTRLSAHPVGQVGSLPGGAPVPAIRVRSPTRCASFTPMIEAAETSFGPRPKCQRMFPARSTSITLLLNWSAMRYRVAEPASPPFWRSDSTPASGAVRALCGAVASRAQDPTSATRDRPNGHATQRAKSSLWRMDEKIGNFDMVASSDGRITHLTDGDTGSDSQWYERELAPVGGARRTYRKIRRETIVMRRDLADKLLSPPGSCHTLGGVFRPLMKCQMIATTAIMRRMLTRPPTTGKMKKP